MRRGKNKIPVIGKPTPIANVSIDRRPQSSIIALAQIIFEKFKALEKNVALPIENISIYQKTKLKKSLSDKKIIFMSGYNKEKSTFYIWKE